MTPAGTFARILPGRHDNLSTPFQFVELDLPRVRKRLRLEERGLERGRAGQPAAAALALDTVEQDAVGVVEAERKVAVEHYLNHRRTYLDRLGALGVRALAAAALADADDRCRRFDLSARTELDGLVLTRDRVLEDDRYLRDFRSLRRLRRPAHYPESHLLQLGILLVILVAEAGLNGVMFARGSEFGLLGGVLTAFLTALVNVAFGFLIGVSALRWLGHRNLGVKLAGLLGLLAYLGLVPLYNLGVAHFRDALGGAAPETAGATALQTLQATPFVLADIQSWMLFGAGLLFSLVALYEGFRWDDPHPGYGRVHRRRRDAFEAYAADKEEVYAGLHEAQEEGARSIEAAQRDIERRLGERQALLAAIQRLDRLIGEHVAYLEGCANALLEAYRSANRAARADPPPPGFDHRWSIAPLPPQSPPPEDPGLEADAHAAFATLQERRDRLRQAYEDAARRFREIDDMVEAARRGDATPA